jgi:hypothetical protein
MILIWRRRPEDDTSPQYSRIIFGDTTYSLDVDAPTPTWGGLVASDNKAYLSLPKTPSELA